MGSSHYISHAAIDNIKTKHANFASAISVGGPAAGVEAILVFIGVTSTIVLVAVPIIAGAIGAAVLDAIENADNGKGTYIDVNQFWTPSTKIYPAW